MISLCLQTCPVDCVPALELAELICDLEPERRPETEFWLIHRKDTPLWVAKSFNNVAAKKFGRSGARMARNYDDGWPGGSNMLAGSAFIEMGILMREGLCKNDGFLLFEPDCCPLIPDWLDQLSAEWDRGKAEGKEIVGHWHQQAGPETLHVNGNGIYESKFIDKHPTWIIGPGTLGWDYWFKDQFVPISCDTYAIFQIYNCPTITPEQLAGVLKHGRRPALLHGIKDGSARVAIRKQLVKAEIPVVNA